jgi:anti-sigma28 factor (negative regulator of flagellin synthesis)
VTTEASHAAAAPETLAQLREAIETGTYEIPASAVADAIISFFARNDTGGADVTDDPDEER